LRYDDVHNFGPFKTMTVPSNGAAWRRMSQNKNKTLRALTRAVDKQSTRCLRVINEIARDGLLAAAL
jgi:hypothetical protein